MITTILRGVSIMETNNNLDFYVPQLLEAIKTRQSRRKYLEKSLTKEHKDNLNNFINSLAVPFEHDIEIILHEMSSASTPAFYFKGTKELAAFIGSTSLTDQGKLGFIGELFILYCESQKIGTCWIGHFKKENVYQSLYGTSENNATKRIHCITPLGYCTDKVTGISDRITTRFFSNKRKSVKDNLHEASLQSFPNYIYYALEFACKAPSALNCQCWYFKVAQHNESFVVEISKPKGYQHFKWPYTDIDVGIAASHFWLGLKEQNISCQVSIEDDTDRAVWKFHIF